LMQAPDHIEQQLQEGARKARAISIPFLKELRDAVGIARIGA
jgi:tryptophanyl-tRNA synthetase